MSDSNDATITMSAVMLGRLITLNRGAYAAVSQVGGNSVQDSYKHNTQKELDTQLELLNIFVPTPADNNDG